MYYNHAVNLAWLVLGKPTTRDNDSLNVGDYSNALDFADNLLGNITLMHSV